MNPKKKQNLRRSPRRENGRIRRPQEPVHSSYTPLSTTVGRVHAQMEDEKILPKPHKLRSPPNRRDQKLYCEYHRDHGHDTDDFRLLKAEITKLIQRGHLKEFVKKNQERSPRRQRESPRRNTRPRSQIPPRKTGRIDTISGGLAGGGDTSNSRKEYARRVVYRMAPMTTIDREIISFSEEGPEGIEVPHDDPLIISPVIANFLVARLLVDTGSSADILYLATYDRLGLPRNLLKPACKPLTGFTGLDKANEPGLSGPSGGPAHQFGPDSAPAH
ncbi:hypothetical protein LIER_39441 [Lithospermum erythrorhizon]|uniref:Uncharacterized protein n=1 Tax=Lithospermum erythrorhizon TaxID=34254 RepID=A0AAV3QEU7_LITER